MRSIPALLLFAVCATLTIAPGHSSAGDVTITRASVTKVLADKVLVSDNGEIQLNAYAVNAEGEREDIGVVTLIDGSQCQGVRALRGGRLEVFTGSKSACATGALAAFRGASGAASASHRAIEAHLKTLGLWP